ncbi:Alanine dehydrogenase [Chitinophaga terrae (ex Kim and Jung 2007)]|uniref:Alanine dehydrogenase n=1 Tax=Chitinophaga terrae (ex Kim and Jung 2007) TaxID=408074 RepID=A0A1H4EPJ4_9BACT|nr:NAD(P)-dependent oxidoreductase [Chitinophaga terrae (ex Kim and Jung 2007)]GEP91780.1 alanine dehydrogenase [Chitinophaga terrae (ex Kim and Jung 2007)]SEA86866.1 Alanine dehydrogenase [Chitinophaga terrae (ex Kim and Jung 2007)]
MANLVNIGLIREEKQPQDNRVAFTPKQCQWIMHHFPQVRIYVQPSSIRAFKDEEYSQAGIPLKEDLADCDILFGIKEIPPAKLIPGKKYLFFSHTKKKQPHNQKMLQEILKKKITLIDYECLVHPDGQRILGFGFFAGIVGAHNGLMAYGEKTHSFHLKRVYTMHDFQDLIGHYFGIKLPPMKIVITGSGRVAAGALEIMGLLGIKYIPPEEYLVNQYAYPVYTQLKAGELYLRKNDKTYSRSDFHQHPDQYECRFLPYVTVSDLLINGIYWDHNIPPLFLASDLRKENFHIKVIADITDDTQGSIPCNLGDSTIENPVYGVTKDTMQQTAPYLADTVDMMCVGNLPNELPRDASQYFGDQLMKYVFEALLQPGNEMMENATITKDGQLTPHYQYLEDYASGKSED